VDERFGPYVLQEMIGRGGMGEVYRAYDTVRKRTVALKRLPAAMAADTGFQARFRRESEVAARLTDEHVIPIHDFGEIDGQLFIDMRYVEAADLASALRDRGPLPAHRAVRVVGQIAGALDSAHAEGLVHRDVKPSNILLRDRRGDDFAYLIDFGIARVAQGTSLTATGATVGTMSYMAPERFLDAAGGDHRVDVYALGCVLHEALTGHPPFPGDDLPVQMYAHLNSPPPQPSRLRPGVPPGFDAVVARAMAKDPGERHASAGELAAHAEAVLAAGQHATRPQPARAGPVRASYPTAPVPPPHPAEQTWPPAPPARGRTAALVIGAVVVVAALVVAGVLLLEPTGGGTGTPAASAGAAATGSPATSSSPAVASASCRFTPSAEAAARPAPVPTFTSAPTSGTVAVTLQTDRGPIPLTLHRVSGPCAVANFLSLADAHYFDDSPCHRLTTAAALKVLQCGDPTGTGTGGPGYTVNDEPPTGLTAAGSGTTVYPRGTLAMAKTAEPDSGGSQFFLVYGDSTISPDYTVFGTVAAQGLATVDAVAAGGTDDANGAGDGAPRTPVTIQRVTVG
jgi:cyclophilin family peptidyl-prolyl cis-trans isomerase